MKLLIPVLFWMGLFGTAWECWQARGQGVAITRVEKLYLGLALPTIFVILFALDLLGAPYAAPSAVLAMGLALNVWVMKRRIQRRTGQ